MLLSDSPDGRKDELTRKVKKVMMELWNQVSDSLRRQVSTQYFDLWIRPINPIKMVDNKFVVEVPNLFHREWIEDNFRALIERELSAIVTKPVSIQFQVADTAAVVPTPTVSTPAVTPTLIEARPTDDVSRTVGNLLSDKYTFESFVVGGSNQFAHAASMAVAENPGRSFNPLFIFGGVGLGKTHLLHAIGNQIKKKSPDLNICFQSAEKFTNELINCIRYEKMYEFRDKYRNSDVFLIDDIQFIAGKERTQEEFFHTFNTLYDSQKQIVMTSDRFPKDIPGIEDRLRSRIEWGLITDIQPPEIETRVAIIKRKAEDEGIPISDEVAMYLANLFQDNVRELEGSLIRISAYSELSKKPITMELAHELFKTGQKSKRPVSIEEIQTFVSEHFQIRMSDLKSSRKVKMFSYPRQIAMYLCKRLTRASFPEIAGKFGGKDHTTVIYACRKIEGQLTLDHDLKEHLDLIHRRIDARSA